MQRQRWLSSTAQIETKTTGYPPRIYLMREGNSDHLDNVLVLDQLDAVDLSLQIRLAVSHLGIRSRKLSANVPAVNTYPS